MRHLAILLVLQAACGDSFAPGETDDATTSGGGTTTTTTTTTTGQPEGGGGAQGGGFGGGGTGGAGGACVPTVTCASVGAECGPVDDGCGGELDCGVCDVSGNPSNMCDGGGKNLCGGCSCEFTPGVDCPINPCLPELPSCCSGPSSSCNFDISVSLCAYAGMGNGKWYWCCP